MNDLERFFETAPHRRMRKWAHYLDTYDRHFARLRPRPVTVVEVGVAQGGSLQMWKSYFAPGSRIIGVDVNRACRELEEDGVEIVIGDQGDPMFWRRFRRRHPQVDILIDDGGHTQTQMRVTFEEMYPHLAADGIYVCEDMQCCYDPRYEGGLGAEGSFMEVLKARVDELNAWLKDGPVAMSPFTRSTASLSFYPFMAVIERRAMTRPRHEVRGEP